VSATPARPAGIISPWKEARQRENAFIVTFLLHYLHLRSNIFSSFWRLKNET
jgi:hypothetical protein